jgi:hypothetical protein
VSAALTRRYSLEQVELGLQAMARARGNRRHARALLKELDPPLLVPDSTLKSWATKQHIARYEQIRTDVQSATQSRAALEVEDALAKSLQRTKEILERMDVTAIPPERLPAALREVATPVGILATQSFTLRGKPLPARQPERSLDEVFNALEALGPGIVRRVPGPAAAIEFVDSTAVEDPTPTDTSEQSP